MAVCPNTLLTPVAVIVLIMCYTTGKSSRRYSLPGPDCNKVYRNLDGAVVEGHGSTDYTSDCEITLSTRRNEYWMYHLEDMSIMNCEVFVDVFAYGVEINSSKSLNQFRCVSPNPGVVTVNSTTVSLKLHHNNRTKYSFKIVFTARKPSDSCEDFVCGNGYCISNDLLCDTIDNCFDFSDETRNSTAFCIEYDPFPGENFSVFAAVIGGSIFMGIAIFCCRMLRQRRHKQDEDDLYDINSGPYLKQYAYKYACIRHHGPHNNVMPHNNTRHKNHHQRSFDHEISGDPEF